MNDGSTCNVDYNFIAIKNTTNLLFLSTTNCKHFKSETSDPLAFCYSTRCKCCCLQVLGTSCIFSWLKQFNISNATFTLPMRCCCLDKFEVEDYGGRDHIRFLVQWQHGLMFIQLVINWFSFQRRKKKKVWLLWTFPLYTWTMLWLKGMVHPKIIIYILSCKNFFIMWATKEDTLKKII